jgi:hypothetical protein
MSIVLGKWRQASSAEMPKMFLPPSGSKGTLNLGNGWGVFEVEGPVSPDLIHVGVDIADKVSGNVKDAVSQALQIPKSDDWVDTERLLWDVMTRGEVCNPLMPTRKGLELHFGKASIVKPFGIGAREWPAVQKVLRGHYRKYQKQYGKSKHHLRVLDFWCKKYGTKDWRQFVPGDLPQEEPLPHATTVTDDFNRANGALGASWNTVSGSPTISSNRAIGTTTNNAGASHATSLSSADHYAQAKVWKSATVTNRVFTRFSNITIGSLEGYLALVRPGTPDQLEIWLVNNATFLQLGTDVGTTTWVDGDTLRLESEGTTHQLFVNGSQVGTNRTDSNDTSTLLVGICSAVATDTQWDDFRGDDDLTSGLTGEVALSGSSSTGSQGAYTLGTSVPL